jgi:hypothetical protein
MLEGTAPLKGVTPNAERNGPADVGRGMPLL